MYFDGKDFLHYKLAEDLMKDYEIRTDRRKLFIKQNGKFVQDEGIIKRIMINYERRLLIKQMNEVIRYLKLVTADINDLVKPTSITPILIGELTPNERQVKVWCPYCKKYHHHGYNDRFKNKGMEQRVAHC